jgi:hypothetical protein
MDCVNMFRHMDRVISTHDFEESLLHGLVLSRELYSISVFTAMFLVLKELYGADLSGPWLLW